MKHPTPYQSSDYRLKSADNAPIHSEKAKNIKIQAVNNFVFLSPVARLQ